ncbi:MAG: YodL domain-containing protein, partial [Lachnospiraceae bacterium]|nr:YodL domain-containing protein [Lachnospiraceae bacterium]
MSGSALEMGFAPQNLRQAELSGESKAMTTGILVPAGERERLSMETSFLGSDSESFAIYRFSDDIPEWSYKEHDLAYVEKLGLRVDGADYDLVYSGRLSEVKSVQDLYNKFSGQLKPSDFPGRSLTMSDVVVVNHDGKMMAWYIDQSGFFRNSFVEMPDFVEQRNSYIRERQLHPDAERHIAQTAKMFSKDRDDKTVLPEEATIIVIPRERVADMEGLTGRKTFYIEFPTENSGTYVQFPKNECRFSEDGESLIVELRDEESYHMFGYLPNAVGEKREFGSCHISGAEVREGLGSKTQAEVREIPAKEESDKKNRYNRTEKDSGREVMVNAGQTPDKETPGVGERLSRRPGIGQEDGFLRLSTGLFGIYQPDENGKYDFVYLGKTSEVGSLSLSNFRKLLQNGRAADFTGRPLSTNDIIVLTGSGKPRVQAFRINGNKLE